MTLPYRYDVLMRVTVQGDGVHADGNGVMATARKIAAVIEAASKPHEGDGGTADMIPSPWPLHPHVVDVSAFPADITYLGKTDFEAPDPAPAGGTFTVMQGGKTTAPIPHGATASEIQQAADDAGVELTFGAGEPPRALGHLNNQAGAEAWRRGG